ncbi:unnamed protein product [Pleuronectes platessa]|uniref:Uncharacterized protein n=1 Tax=Pleuronectes platessa TaxID=8262 RepID=A0A9N7W369_PLEPL|nr:unnamed protein product [Pleuronectes platessa]
MLRPPVLPPAPGDTEALSQGRSALLFQVTPRLPRQTPLRLVWLPRNQRTAAGKTPCLIYQIPKIIMRVFVMEGGKKLTLRNRPTRLDSDVPQFIGASTSQGCCHPPPRLLHPPPPPL